jgi:hypothetical protein
MNRKKRGGGEGGELSHYSNSSFIKQARLGRPGSLSSDGYLSVFWSPTALSVPGLLVSIVASLASGSLELPSQP